jgi:cell division protein FtsI (penicillin-binding protein 3)
MSGTPPRRWVFFVAVLAVWALVVVGRLAQIQIVRGSAFAARARQQQERTVAISPRRGSILDRAGRELAVSVEVESIFAVPDKVEDVDAESRTLAALLGEPAREIRERLASDRSFVWIARKVKDSTAAAVRGRNLPGIDFLPEARRYYPNGTLAANVLGYVGLDGRGLAGLEYEYDGLVRGRDGEMRVARDARQGRYALSPIPGHEAIQGKPIQITIDRDIQFVVESELARAAAETGARDASAVMLDPETGRILAMATVPTFDPNRYADFPPSAWRNRPIADSFEPGSVFKVVVGATALDQGVARPDDPIDCGNGAIQVGNYWMHDAEHERFGVIPFSEVIAKSSNVGMIRIGLRLGPDRLYSGIRRFGIGEPTGVDLPGENGGILRTVSEWSALSNASLSYGQEVSVTPLQLAVAISAIANGGYRVQPTILESVRRSDGSADPAPAGARERILSAGTAAEMNAILKDVVEDGTGKRAAVSGYSVAGKTGTAQKAVGRGYAPDKYVATFAGYAPAERPRVALVVTIDEPRGQYFASEVAAPVFSRILGQTLTILGVPSDGTVIPERAAPPTVTARAVHPFIPGVLTASLGRDGGDSTLRRMPDLHGLPARQAVAELSRLGISPRLSGSGLVVEQTPLPGRTVSPADPCALRLAGPTAP